VATQVFTPITVAWLSFAIAAGVTVAALATIPGPMGLLQRGLSGAAVVLGAWTIVASLVFAPTTVVWLGFASALGFVGLAVAGLTAHELTTERVVHSLQVDRAPLARTERAPIAA
jgi:hypothetical protein